MHNSSTAPGGSQIKRTTKPETTKTENVITLGYLKQYFDAFHPKDGTELNIIASLDDNLNKINLMEDLTLQRNTKH
ncbi:hypothetical protein [Rickettsia argasii]|uniref:Uncharacterized protein n=1 Tax=Rickettsia argasii T170-B TaxID=1268837 RepID=A0A0F3RFB0_9RICK|nr:hypothetical protein [Rickettsia argasii]KJW05110.1 hypothetical protein RAT170B_0813 [Rickettsia argasii T170-B]